jgi:hypothetical protein
LDLRPPLVAALPPRGGHRPLVSRDGAPSGVPVRVQIPESRERENGVDPRSAQPPPRFRPVRRELRSRDGRLRGAAMGAGGSRRAIGDAEGDGLREPGPRRAEAPAPLPSRPLPPDPALRSPRRP